MNIRSKKGQSTLEYIILVTAIIAVAIVFLKPMGADHSGGGFLVNTIEASHNAVANGIVEQTGGLTTKWQSWDE